MTPTFASIGTCFIALLFFTSRYGADSSIRSNLFEVLQEEVEELAESHAKTPPNNLEALQAFASFDTVLQNTFDILFKKPTMSGSLAWPSLSDLVSIRKRAQGEQSMRHAVLESNYAYLLENSLDYPHYTPALEVVCNHLKDASTSDAYNAYINQYFRVLEPALRPTYFESFLKHAIGLPDHEDKRGMLTFQALTATAMKDNEKNLDQVVKTIATTVCTAKHVANGAYKLAESGTPAHDACIATVSTHQDTMVAQALIYLQHKHQYPALAAMLTQNPKIIDPFFKCLQNIINDGGLRTTVKKWAVQQTPYWQRIFSKFSWAALREDSFKSIRLMLTQRFSTLCANTKGMQKFCTQASSSWLDALLVCAESHAVSQTLKPGDKQYVPQHTALLKRFCALDTTTYTSEQAKYVYITVQNLQDILYDYNSPQQNSAMIDLLLSRSYTSIIDIVVNKWNKDKYITIDNFIAVTKKNIQHLSADDCYNIATLCANKYTARADLRNYWITEAARKGHEKSVGLLFLDSAVKGKLVQNSSIFEAACTANPTNFYNRTMRDLCYIHAIGNNMESLLPSIDVYQFCTDFLTRNPKPQSADTELTTLYGAYAWAFTKILAHKLYNAPINQTEILSLLKNSYIRILACDKTALNPLAITPKAVLSYYESVIQKECTGNNNSIASRENVATATLLLSESLPYSIKNNMNLCLQGIAHALGITHLEPAMYEETLHTFFKKENFTGFRPMLLAVLAHQADLENFFQTPVSRLNVEAENPASTKIEQSLSSLLLTSPIYATLQTLCASDTIAAEHAMCFMIRGNICKEDSDDKGQILRRLCDMYKKTDSEYYSEACKILQKHVTATLEKKESVEFKDTLEECMVIHKKLEKNIPPTKEDHQRIQSYIKSPTLKPLSMYYALEAALYAVMPLEEHSFTRSDLIFMALAQAYHLGADEGKTIKTFNPWLVFVTPALRAYMWKETTTQTDPPIMQNDLLMRGYAALLNEKNKTKEKRITLLKPGIEKNAFCTLLYAQCITDNWQITPHHMPEITERIALYNLMRYAVMQGQRSKKEAASLDQATQTQASIILQDWMHQTDIGASITFMSTILDVVTQMKLLVCTPFELNQSSTLKFDPHHNELIKYAESYNLIEPIKKESLQHATHETLATAALFRMYLPGVNAALGTKKNYIKNIAFIECILSYCPFYISAISNDEHKKAVQKTVMEFINKALEFAPKNQALKTLKRNLEKLWSSKKGTT